MHTHPYTHLRRATLAVATAALLTACGGGSDEPSVPDGPPPIPAAMHIGMEVDGAAILIDKRAEGWWGDNIPPSDDPRAYLTAAEGNYGSPTALTSWELDIHIGSEPKAGATYDCTKDEAWIQLIDRTRANISISWSDATKFLYADKGIVGSACSVTVKAVSADEISGRFSATVVYSKDASDVRSVTNGSFRIPASTGPEPM